MLVVMAIPRLRTTCSSNGSSRPISIPTGTRWISSFPSHTASSSERTMFDTRSIWLNDPLEILAPGMILGKRRQYHLGAPGDDVQRRADLVRDARGELPGHGQRLRAAQLLLEVQGVLALRHQALTRLFEPLGHAVEGLRQLAQLVVPLHGQRRPAAALAEGADRVGQLRQRAKHLALQHHGDQQRQHDRQRPDPQQHVADGPAIRRPAVRGGKGDLQREPRGRRATPAPAERNTGQAGRTPTRPRRAHAARRPLPSPSR